ncbi:hypothetical protein M407DRAFT_245681 [Tulasnella calospora MUT 4182]|uniref:Uncharacterized protein n=1 Tax=Tulasnella calospora MUT 4182 TaxID=1051891 RepID=A0A0C3LH96_9AGAM|nr:hypothetical protein M407DRAFT_245681 [Tulasnella calospora MUT 4182]
MTLCTCFPLKSPADEFFIPRPSDSEPLQSHFIHRPMRALEYISKCPLIQIGCGYISVINRSTSSLRSATNEAFGVSALRMGPRSHSLVSNFGI